MQKSKTNKIQSGSMAETHGTPEKASGRERNPSSTVDREANQTTHPEVQQVRRELRNDDSNDVAVDEPNIMAQRLDARPFSSGKKVENHLPDDDETTERLVQKGADDAEDEEMLEADKTWTKSEG